jgi:uncharacterized membrane protein (TIGR02234 family)
MGYVVTGCLGGAGLALIAARQQWAAQVTRREQPLPPVRETFTGADLVPWLPAIALVALAAGVAVLATRGMGRLLVGVVTLGCGLAIVTGAGYGMTVAQAGGRTVMAAGSWPLVGLAGGLMVVVAASLVVRHGRGWPSMGARHERGHHPGDPARVAGHDPARMWDALDEGADPTGTLPGR